MAQPHDIPEVITLQIPFGEALRDIAARGICYKRYPFGDYVCIVKVIHKDYKAPARRSTRARRAIARRASTALPPPVPRQQVRRLTNG